MVSLPVITNADIARLDNLLKKHHQCFENVYDRYEVSINYHIVLHFPDIIKDFGPPHSFWCFSFERMNRVLSGFPSSNCYIELEYFTKFLQDSNISFVTLSTVQVEGSWPNLKDMLPVENEPSFPAFQHPIVLNYRTKSFLLPVAKIGMNYSSLLIKGMWICLVMIGRLIIYHPVD